MLTNNKKNQNSARKKQPALPLVIANLIIDSLFYNNFKWRGRNEILIPDIAYLVFWP